MSAQSKLHNRVSYYVLEYINDPRNADDRLCKKYVGIASRYLELERLPFRDWTDDVRKELEQLKTSMDKLVVKIIGNLGINVAYRMKNHGK